jgi:peptidoglycan/LPS O-acetylase OafA/YrhL
MVMLLHFIADAEPTNRVERLVVQITNFGDRGVDLFFVLSGFLITGILVDAKNSTGYFRNFYMRRTLRIFPLYYGALVLIFVVAPLIPALRGPDLATLQSRQAWAWLYGVNVYDALHGAFSFPYIDHFWSLAVEEHFYFVWPFLVWACPAPKLPGLAAGLAFGALAGRVLAAAAGVDPLALHILTPFRLDALLLGGFLAAAAREPGGLLRLQRAMVPALAGACSIFAGSYLIGRALPRLFEPTHQLRSSIFALFFGALIVTSLTAPPSSRLARGIGAPWLRFLGKYSYGLYVFHHFVAYFMIENRTEFVVARYVGSHALAVLLQASVGAAVSLGLAMASYHLYEKRFLAFKRFWPSATPAEATPADAPGTPVVS